MDNLDEILKNQMIMCFEQNNLIKTNITTILNNYYLQNTKYHIMWLFFHSFSFAYPDEPSEEYKIETANFIGNIIPKNITGCGSCQNDYRKYIENLNIYRIVSSKQELSTFFYQLHNHINEIKNKNLNSFQQKFNITINNKNTYINVNPTFEEIKQKYNDVNYTILLEEKYKINIFKLIEDKSLSSFYTLFNKINIEDTLNVFNIDINIS